MTRTINFYFWSVANFTRVRPGLWRCCFLAVVINHVFAATRNWYCLTSHFRLIKLQIINFSGKKLPAIFALLNPPDILVFVPPNVASANQLNNALPGNVGYKPLHVKQLSKKIPIFCL